MTDLPDLKIKTLVSFPASVIGGAGINVTKQNGSYQFDLAYQDFAPPVGSIADAPHQNALLWNSITGSYILAPVSLLGGSGGAGDVTGPAGAVAGNIATFSGTTGKIIQDGGQMIASLAPLANPSFTGLVSVSGAGGGFEIYDRGGASPDTWVTYAQANAYRIFNNADGTDWLTITAATGAANFPGPVAVGTGSTARTPVAADNSTKISTTTYVDNATYGLRGHMSGYQLTNNATTPNSKIDIANGYCRDQNFNRYNIFCGGFTKDLAAPWAAGNAGGLDTGAKAINTWYFLHAIYNPATQASDVLFSASPSAPTLPSGFTAFRRIRGAVLTDPSGNIKAFVQLNNTFKWSVPIADFNGVAVPDTLAHLRKLSTPTGIRTIAIIHARAIITTAGQAIATIFTDPAMADTPADFVLAQQIGNTTLSPFAQMLIGTDTASNIRVRSNISDGTTAFYIITEGWIDAGEL